MDTSQGYETERREIGVAGRQWMMEMLIDRQQFFDPTGEHEAAGVPPSMWSLFGVVWAAGITLAELMAVEDIAGLDVMEAGCGLGLASLVIHSRGGNVVATDMHPLAASFLTTNARLNNLDPIDFETARWGADKSTLGTFDLIIGSDLLYEPQHPDLLAGFVDRHCSQRGSMLLTDAGRGHIGKFNRRMNENGFTIDVQTEGRARIARYARSISDQ